MRVNQINCDACDHDLTYTGNVVDYRLVLSSEKKGYWPKTQAVTAMGIYPAIDRTHHFCGIGCLVAWLDSKHPEAA